MERFKLVTLLFLPFILASCATPVPKNWETPTGKPEVVIQSMDVATIKSAILAEAMEYNYMLEQDSGMIMILSRATEMNEDMMAALTIGNSYSTNSRTVTVNIIPLNEQTRVVAMPALRAQLPMGKVNQTPLHNNGAIFNGWMESLLRIKEQVENPGSTQQQSVAVTP